MTIDGVKLELYHWAPAHTSGDLVVYNPAAKVVSTGDIVVTNRADDNPNIHFEKNGSTAGWLANVKGMIGLNATTYVTGHGDLLTKADLQRKFDAHHRAAQQDCRDGEGRQDARRDQGPRCPTLRPRGRQLAAQAARVARPPVRLAEAARLRRRRSSSRRTWSSPGNRT